MARYACGVLAMYEHDFALADREMTVVLVSMPGFAAAHHNRGSIAQWQQDYAASIAHFRQAVALNPAAHDSAVALAQSLFAAGRYEVGWKYFARRRAGATGSATICRGRVDCGTAPRCRAARWSRPARKASATSCWCWGGNARGTTTLWYPGMRIFRQPAFGDLESVVGELERALIEWQSSLAR
jgi:hypothetical protein